MDSSSDLPRVATILMALSYEMGLPPSPRVGLATAHNIEFGGTFCRPFMCAQAYQPRAAVPQRRIRLKRKICMTIASLPEIGGSFILPAKAAARIRDDILLCGEPMYSWFGLQAEDTDGINSTKVVVRMVAENAPAKKAGFMVGDEILAVNSKKISNNTQLRNITFFVRPGETAEFKIKRGNSVLKLDVLAERMAPDIIRAAEKNISPPHANIGDAQIPANISE
ncbi:MAG: PDZ domain-containing protein [Bacilli bacterium]